MKELRGKGVCGCGLRQCVGMLVGCAHELMWSGLLKGGCGGERSVYGERRVEVGLGVRDVDVGGG